MARKPTETLSATDAVDGELIKGSGEGSSAEQQEVGSTENGEASPGSQSQDTSSEQSASSASSSLASDLAEDVREVEQFGATVIHTTVASVQAITRDGEAAMMRVRADVAALSAMVANVGHFSSLPIVEAEKLIGSIATHLGVIRGA